jgi:hypothetical protein
LFPGKCVCDSVFSESRELELGVWLAAKEWINAWVTTGHLRCLELMHPFTTAWRQQVDPPHLPFSLHTVVLTGLSHLRVIPTVMYCPERQRVKLQRNCMISGGSELCLCCQFLYSLYVYLCALTGLVCSVWFSTQSCECISALTSVMHQPLSDLEMLKHPGKLYKGVRFWLSRRTACEGRCHRLQFHKLQSNSDCLGVQGQAASPTHLL